MSMKLNKLDIETVEVRQDKKFINLFLDDKRLNIQLPKSNSIFGVQDYQGNQKYKMSYVIDEESLNQINILKEAIESTKNIKLSDFVKSTEDGKKYINLSFDKYSKVFDEDKKLSEEIKVLNHTNFIPLISVGCCKVGKFWYLRFVIRQALIVSKIELKPKKELGCLIEEDEE